MFVDMFYTSFFGMPNPDPVMRRNMICSNPGAFNAFKMQRLMDMPTFKSFLMSKYTKQEIWNALPNPFDLITNLISYPNMALRLLSSSQYYVIMQTFNAMTNTDFLTCFYQFRPQNYFSYVYSLGQLGSIFAKGYPIMTFMSDFARNNPSQIEALWNAMLGSYGQYYSSFKLSELDLYGAKRLGNIQDTLKLNSFYFNGSYNAASNSYNISSTFAPTYGASVNYYLTSFTYGKKQYEITNHLGNVLSTVSDYKLPYLNSSGKLCYNPDVRSENKYYAFGGAKDGFAAANLVNNYSYGYQGSMKNNGLDGTINTFFRQGDVEGLFWTSVDPKFYLTPWESPYSLMGGNPVIHADPQGDFWPLIALAITAYAIGESMHETDQAMVAKSKGDAKGYNQHISNSGEYNSFIATDLAGTAVVGGAIKLYKAYKYSKTVIVATDATKVVLKINKIRAGGDVGEQFLKTLGGISQKYFPTIVGKGGRYVDQFVNGVAHESKVGYTTLTPDIKMQIAKDAELLGDKASGVKEVVWNFFRSPVTGKIGASRPLLKALEDAGIKTQKIELPK